MVWVWCFRLIGVPQRRAPLERGAIEIKKRPHIIIQASTKGSSGKRSDRMGLP